RRQRGLGRRRQRLRGLTRSSRLHHDGRRSIALLGPDRRRQETGQSAGREQQASLHRGTSCRVKLAVAETVKLPLGLILSTRRGNGRGKNTLRFSLAFFG